MKHTLATIHHFLTTPVPHTPALSHFLPTAQGVNRTLALAMAAVVFYTQAVCAGTASLPLLDEAVGRGQGGRAAGLSRQPL